MTRFMICLPLLAATYGCNTQPPIDARQEVYTAKQIQLADEDLRRNTRFEQPRVTRDPAGLLFVTVPMRATIQYRATWLDENGQPLPGSPTTWQDKTLNPRVFESITTNSTSPRAEDFVIDVRYAR
jgi:uncharacterized protein DUF1425